MGEFKNGGGEIDLSQQAMTKCANKTFKNLSEKQNREVIMTAPSSEVV